MPISLPELPFAPDALAPVISARTLEFHHGKHHRAYVDNANKLIAGTDLDAAAPEDIIQKTAGDTAKTGIFNNVAQAWNHSFYWQGIKPGGGGPPVGSVADRIKAAWGDYAAFVDALKTAGTNQFGSGWVWLVAEGMRSRSSRPPMPTHRSRRASSPSHDRRLGARLLPRLQNRRADYLVAFIDKLINWDFVNRRLGA